ncbi:helix-turn-helix domain-containing protein [Streptomyces ipomoeae]|jgi:excisionase family DNA binding protein|uniref:DNA binding domain protein, excisionase family n=1 Tax=Streptomyces ipomoeae 91-03 TaxID=698759 RepID=L1KKN3_9ACTN|nr:helix-turn-helix domain-containing protein [Streptomyces ipomoeae]EKX61157.1 DNA binding domain protein, excisionase family [Streptomyces ipomoeae 91-03]MDX2696878.1 helix-turn-helix domain-containing protein [Streptomyces ipomoeae]MDX2827986.1 helix-turn-helix domain-containing protein [Streptomyces ipomoeae]MDX2846008.1 helix-turn-helix domain-containing protein [Streptomyces ipomoeae]MDX2880514.1 helix-turn-helix domain-containing protein [Streptomyces ipomoeae]
MTTVPPDLLTVPDVMARLKLGKSKVYDLIRTKRLASFTEGRARRIPETAVQEYIRARLEEGS